MARLKTPREQLGAGLACLAIAGGVVGLTLYRRASWSLDGIEAVVVLVPVGIYLVLKGGLGYDLLVELRLLRGKRSPRDPE